INTLEDAIASIAANNPSDASSQLTTAINAFDAAVLDTTGLFGPRGVYRRAPKNVTLPPGVTNGQVASSLVVSGTIASDGTATLTGTLTSGNGSAHTGQSGALTLAR